MTTAPSAAYESAVERRQVAKANRLHDAADEASNAGDHRRAERACRRALAIFELQGGARSPDVANLSITLSRILVDRGERPAAVEAARRAWEILGPLRGRAPELSMLRLFARQQLGAALREAGDFRRARPLLLHAVRDAERRFGGDSVELALALNHVGILCKYTSRYEDGLSAYRRSLAILRRKLGPSHPELASIHHNLGGIEHHRGRFRSAAAHAARSLAIREAALGRSSPLVAADAAAYAAILAELGRRREARALYTRAHRVFLRVYGDHHYEVAMNTHNLAALDASSGRLRSAEARYRRATELFARSIGRDHPDTALARYNLAALLTTLGRTGEARPHCVHARRVFEGTFGRTHPHTVSTLELLAELDAHSRGAASGERAARRPRRARRVRA
ncbi:MAG: tetratricopeptide repeat protein [Labilithrix sp.]|nr:tetratricopeptide repeat protein [Labilithrix sp.]MBX3211637.1 tetratricopeptide repeat protein [Labilithrix sp.]